MNVEPKLLGIERALIVLEVLLGLTAVLGGLLQLPALTLNGTPFTTFLIPGLLLFGALGAFPLAVAWATRAQAPWATVGHLAVGVALLGWVSAQVLLIGFGSVMQGLALVLGLVICVLGARASAVRRSEVSIRVPLKFSHELAALKLAREPVRLAEVITEADLAQLPEPAQRYLQFMNVVGRPRDWSFRLALGGRFRLSGNARWARCSAWQYNTRLGLARIFHLQLRLFGVVPVLARDTYFAGHGRMLVRAADLLTLVDGQGDGFDSGELMTYLNDALLVAPSMLLGPEVKWSWVDTRSFDVALTDHGRTVNGRVFVDERGAPTTFEAERYHSASKDTKQSTLRRWSTPVAGWRLVDGRQRFVRAQAVWHLPSGTFSYADFLPVAGSVVFNVAPGA